MLIISAESIKRQQFNPRDLKILFDTPEMSGNDWYNIFYWPTLIALYQGCRRTEIPQLSTVDIVNLRGIECLIVTDKGLGQKLKNCASERIIPTHSHLLQRSIMNFVNQVRIQLHDRLFYWIKPDSGGRFGAYSKHYGRFM